MGSPDAYRKFTERELDTTAREIRTQYGKGSPRVFICYYLEGMERGSGAWATTHFNPDLKVEVLGIPAGLEDQILAESEGETLGQWIDESPMSGGIIAIRKTGRVLEVETTYVDGSSSRAPLVERRVGRELRFVMKDNDFGEYYVIDSKGRLRICDREGLITTASPAKGQDSRTTDKPAALGRPTTSAK